MRKWFAQRSPATTIPYGRPQGAVLLPLKVYPTADEQLAQGDPCLERSSWVAVKS
jgi:hypothetical protein